jgi:hypothetical protein
MSVIQEMVGLIGGTHAAVQTEEDDFDPVKLLSYERDPEDYKQAGIKSAVRRGIYAIYNDLDLGAYKKFKVGGKPFYSVKGKGTKRAVAQVISKEDWMDLKDEYGLRSKRDLPPNTPVTVFFDVAYSTPGEYGFSIWSFGYTTAKGREVYLHKGRLSSDNLSRLAKKLRQ